MPPPPEREVPTPPEREVPATRPLDGEPDRQVLRFASLAPGSVFAGRYEIRDRLGSGGAGEVFRALDRVSGAEIALKVLYPRADAGPRPLERLRRELQLARRLTHPGIIRLHDIGEWDGLLYLVMDLLVGESLRTLLSRGPVPAQDAESIATAIVEALAAAHAAGVVHRDIKPANIFLPAGARPAPVVLLDFGIARDAEGGGLTATGALLGTPEYMAPEQAVGERGIGPAADVYSAGLVMWELFSGDVPFHADSAIEVLRRHAKQPLPPAAKHLGRAPRHLRELIPTMLEKDPARRPASAVEILPFLVERRRLPLVRRVAIGARRSAVRFALLLGAVALAVLGLVPWRAAVSGSALEVKSLAGFTIRRAIVDGAPRATVPLDPDAVWSRRYLVLLRGIAPAPPASADGSDLFAVVDLLRGRSEPLRVRGAANVAGCPTARFDRLACDVYGDSMTVIPPSRPAGAPLFAVRFVHRQYPGALYLVSPSGFLFGSVVHPGQLQDPLLVTGSSARGAPDLLAVPGENHDLEQRTVLLGVTLFRDERFGGGDLFVPPFDVRGTDSGEHLPAYYTFTSRERISRAELNADGLALSFESGATFRFDARTGVPLDGPDRLGTSADTWLENQKRTLSALRSAAEAERSGHRRDAVASLVALAARPDLAPSQRGVVLGRAAVLMRRDGPPFDDAIALTRRAIEIEPLVSGHGRRLLDLLARAGRFREALDPSGATFGSRLVNRAEFVRDRFFAGLLSRDDGVVGQLDEMYPAGVDDSYSLMCRSTLALHRGEFSAAVTAAGSDPRTESIGDLQFVVAIARALSTPPDWKGALAALERAELHKCEGQTFATKTLRALIARHVEYAAPSGDDIERELRAIDAAASDNIVDWYFEAWAHAIAGRLFREQGDARRFEIERKRVQDHPGAGPYVRAVLSKDGP